MSFGPTPQEQQAAQYQQKYNEQLDTSLDYGKGFIDQSAGAVGAQNAQLDQFMKMVMGQGTVDSTRGNTVANQFGALLGGLAPQNRQQASYAGGANPFTGMAQTAAEQAAAQYRTGSDALAADLASRGLGASSGAGAAALATLNYQGGQAQDAARRQAVAQGAQFFQQGQQMDLQRDQSALQGYGQLLNYEQGNRGMDMQAQAQQLQALLGALGMKSQNVGGLLNAGTNIYGGSLGGMGGNTQQQNQNAAQSAQAGGAGLGGIFGGLLGLVGNLVAPGLGTLVSGLFNGGGPTRQAQPYGGTIYTPGINNSNGQPSAPYSGPMPGTYFGR